GGDGFPCMPAQRAASLPDCRTFLPVRKRNAKKRPCGRRRSRGCGFRRADRRWTNDPTVDPRRRAWGGSGPDVDHLPARAGGHPHPGRVPRRQQRRPGARTHRDLGAGAAGPGGCDRPGPAPGVRPDRVRPGDPDLPQPARSARPAAGRCPAPCLHRAAGPPQHRAAPPVPHPRGGIGPRADRGATAAQRARPTARAARRAAGHRAGQGDPHAQLRPHPRRSLRAAPPGLPGHEPEGPGHRRAAGRRPHRLRHPTSRRTGRHGDRGPAPAGARCALGRARRAAHPDRPVRLAGAATRAHSVHQGAPSAADPGGLVFTSRLADRWRSRDLLTDLVQVLKSVLAATLAWWISVWVLHSELPFLAPWIALLTVQVTVYRSVRSGVQIWVASALGVGVAYLVGTFLGVNLWTFALAVFVGLLGARIPLLRTEGVAIATTAIFVLGSGFGTQEPLLNNRLLEAALGVAVALAVNLLIAPP